MMKVRLDENIMNLENLTKYLSDEKPNLATQRKIAKLIIEKLDSETIIHYLRVLSQDENLVCRTLSCYLLPFCHKIIKDKEEIERVLFRLADDKDWRVRENAAWCFYKLLLNDFDTIYLKFIDWGKYSNENIRRAIIIAAMKVAKHREEKYAKPLLDLIELFLKDKSKYVQKAIIFSLGDGFLRYYPKYTFIYLKSWIKKRNETQIQWIVAMSLSMAEARNYMKESMKILKELSFNNEKTIQNALVKALINLAKKNPGGVHKEVRTWVDTPAQHRIVSRILKKIDSMEVIK